MSYKRYVVLLSIFGVMCLCHITLLYRSYRESIFETILDQQSYSPFLKNNKMNLNINNLSEQNITDQFQYIGYSVLKIFLICWTYIFWIPLIYLYLYGPSIHQWLFWQGKSWNEMCVILSGGTMDSLFWLQHPTDCTHLIFQNVDAFLIASHFTLTVVTIIFMLYLIYSDWIYLSMMDKVDRLLQMTISKDKIKSI